MNLYKLHEILQTHDISIEDKEGFFCYKLQKKLEILKIEKYKIFKVMDFNL